VKRVSAVVSVTSGEARKPKAKKPNSVAQLARIISRPAKYHRHAQAVKPVFLAENETSPLDALTLLETRVKLMALIRTLDHQHRQVLLLHYYSGLKAHQIAVRLGLPVSNIQGPPLSRLREVAPLGPLRFPMAVAAERTPGSISAFGGIVTGLPFVYHIAGAAN